MLGWAGGHCTLRLGRLVDGVLAQLSIKPQLHADEGLSAFLGQLAPRFGPGQHVTHAPLRQTKYLNHKEEETKRNMLLCSTGLCLQDLTTA